MSVILIFDGENVTGRQVIAPPAEAQAGASIQTMGMGITPSPAMAWAGGGVAGELATICTDGGKWLLLGAMGLEPINALPVGSCE